MRDPSSAITGTLAHQQAIQAKCVHPTGTFIEFKREEIEQSIPARFEHQVRQYPHRLAVKTRNHALTYEALNQAANRVARAILIQRGEREAPIALLFEQGVWAAVAILGALKAGKIYVPLDSSYPPARLSYMLEDSQASLLVTNNPNLSLARELARNRRPLLNIDELDSGLSAANLGLSLSPGTLAYIIYTSGSTGQPKGVVDSHRNVLHSIMNLTNDSHICADDRLTLLYSCSVVGMVRYMLGALLNGASLYPLDIKKEGLTNLANWLIQEEITIYPSIVMLFRQFVSTLSGREQFPKLRLIQLGGEPLLKSDVELYKRHFSPDCICDNILSTTETAAACRYFIDKKTPLNGNIVPVGYTVADKELLVLDEAGAAIGFDRVGEIAVRSRYLSPGYWRRPDLTGAKFISDPHGGDERTYLTGDRGRMEPDGCLVHLGRQDFQVKIRGYRIELGEIETALLALDTIKEAVVVVRQDQGVDDRLVAYVVPAEQACPTVTSLHHTLAAKLPDHMVPSAFVLLDALPRTPNGKVDRRTLPAPRGHRPNLGNPFIAPHTPIEQALALIWAEVLGLEPVGIHDHFLELGGHSLLATQIVSRVREVFHVEVTLPALLEAPTVAEMAMVITQSGTRSAEREDMEPLMAAVEALSDAQAQRLLAEETLRLLAEEAEEHRGQT